MDYPIYLFDSLRHQDLLPMGKITNIKMVAAAVEKMQVMNDGINPRFVRLGVRLKESTDRFPVFTDQKDTGYFWLNNPLNLLKTHEGALWQPEMYDWDKIPDFFKVLFPLARMLRLDIYDEFRQVYVPAWSMGVPLEESSKYRLAWDPDMAKTLELSKDAVKKRLLEKLTGPLTERGFELSDVVEDGSDYQPWIRSFIFHREIPGGDQIIVGRIFKESPSVRCCFDLVSGSYRLTEICIKYLGDDPDDVPPPPWSGVSNLQRNTLKKLLAGSQPGWKNPDEIEWTGTIEEVDWRAADILEIVLPLMERLRTMGGADDHRYNEAMRDVLDNLTKDSFSWRAAIFSTIDAHCIGNMERFEFLVQRIEKCLEGPFKEPGNNYNTDSFTIEGYREEYADLVDKCRKGIIPKTKRDDPY
jgi:hypothetical protein